MEVMEGTNYQNKKKEREGGPGGGKCPWKRHLHWRGWGGGGRSSLKNWGGQAQVAGARLGKKEREKKLAGSGYNSNEPLSWRVLYITKKTIYRPCPSKTPVGELTGVTPTAGHGGKNSPARHNLLFNKNHEIDRNFFRPHPPTDPQTLSANGCPGNRSWAQSETRNICHGGEKRRQSVGKSVRKFRDKKKPPDPASCHTSTLCSQGP